MSTSPESDADLKLTSMAVDRVAAVLAKVSARPISESTIREDIEAGAPVNDDGTVNLFDYAAWLTKDILNA
jgi:nicotinic acid mononucleotide adenylyltransferase